MHTAADAMQSRCHGFTTVQLSVQLPGCRKPESPAGRGVNAHAAATRSAESSCGAHLHLKEVTRVFRHHSLHTISRAPPVRAAAVHAQIPHGGPHASGARIGSAAKPLPESRARCGVVRDMALKCR